MFANTSDNVLAPELTVVNLLQSAGKPQEPTPGTGGVTTVVTLEEEPLEPPSCLR